MNIEVLVKSGKCTKQLNPRTMLDIIKMLVDNFTINHNTLLSALGRAAYCYKSDIIELITSKYTFEKSELNKIRDNLGDRFYTAA